MNVQVPYCQLFCTRFLLYSALAKIIVHSIIIKISQSKSYANLNDQNVLPRS